MGARRASVAAVVAVAAAVLLVSLLVTWAASIGPDTVLPGKGPATHRVTVAPTETTASGRLRSHNPRVPQPSSATAHVVGRAVITAFVLAVVLTLLGLALLAARWLWERWQLRRRPPPPPAEVDFDPLEEPGLVAEQMVRDAARQRALLLEGTPRNAIVAAWNRFEEQAAAAGVLRRPWETSAEFTLRVLELVEADSSSVARLAALFREARFSGHAMGEPERAEALAALDRIHATLPTLAGGAR